LNDSTDDIVIVAVGL